MVIVEWAVAVGLFWIVSALFLGGAPIRYENTGAGRELGGLLVGFALYLVAWKLLVGSLGALLPGFGAFVVGSLLAVGLAPILCVMALRLFGTRVRWGRAEAH